MQTISVAQHEYYSRPADQRMASPQALVAEATARKAACREVSYNAKDLRVLPMDGSDGAGRVAGQHGRIALASPRGQAELTPWSHGQLCRLVGAPAAYIRSLPGQVAADALNHGLQTTAAGTTAVILGQRDAAAGTVTARAITSETYGRLWDADYYGPVVDMLCSQGWALPPTWDGQPAGAYLSDRDSFLILCNGGSIVSDPTLMRGGGAGTGGDGGAMFRAVMLRNSETGLTAVAMDEVLYRYICGNHMLWGAVYGAQFRRRHVGTAVLRDTLREVGALARRVANRPASVDEQLIKALADRQLAETREGLIDELRKMGATLADAQAAYDATVRSEAQVNPLSYWGVANGLTRTSQDSGYQDERLQLDALAAKVLSRGRQLVAA